MQLVRGYVRGKTTAEQRVPANSKMFLDWKAVCDKKDAEFERAFALREDEERCLLIIH